MNNRKTHFLPYKFEIHFYFMIIITYILQKKRRRLLLKNKFFTYIFEFTDEILKIDLAEVIHKKLGNTNFYFIQNPVVL